MALFEGLRLGDSLIPFKSKLSFNSALCFEMHSAALCIGNSIETFLLTQDETRKCLNCGEIKPLTGEHFQAIRFFVKKFSFYCIACDAESKTRKTRPEDVSG